MHTKTLKQLSGLLKDKKISATELAQIFLNRIAHSDLNAFTSVEPELTLAQAKAADARIAAGEAGDLIGVPWKLPKTMLGNFGNVDDAKKAHLEIIRNQSAKPGATDTGIGLPKTMVGDYSRIKG